MMKKLLLTVYVNLFLCLTGMAQLPANQKKHLVYFADKSGTPFSIQAPQEFLSQKSIARRVRQQIPVITRDLPVNPAYVAGLKAAGASVWYTSRWFNAAVIQASPEILEQIRNLPYVKSERALNSSLDLSADKAIKQKTIEAVPLTASLYANSEQDYGRAFHQANMLGAVDLHKAGFKGEGMTIAVLDAGFPNVNTIPAFSHLFQNNQLKGTFDFVTRQKDVYHSSSHGTAVLSTMAAYEPGKYIGTGYKADFLLLRTEDGASEHNIEEINWLLGAEFADSAGADVINSSLGYHTFDSPSVSYTYTQLNGNTALVTKAADFAAAAGILVVTSAGNDGNKAWKFIAAPADADSVLAVGAVDSLGVRASFSSLGPTADNRIKPDVVALGLNAYVLSLNGNVVKSNGTSFAGPIIAGFATALWQANLTKTNMQMVEFIRQIGSISKAPNNNIGFGIPNFNRTVTALPEDLKDEGVVVVNPVRDNQVMLILGEKWQRQQIELNIFDITGKVVWKEILASNQAKATLSLDARQLKQGVYLCRLKAGALNTTVRFIKL
jgi:serine protease AprX